MESALYLSLMWNSKTLLLDTHEFEANNILENHKMQTMTNYVHEMVSQLEFGEQAMNTFRFETQDSDNM